MKRLTFLAGFCFIVISISVLPVFSNTANKPPKALKNLSAVNKKIDHVSGEVLVSYNKGSASKVKNKINGLSYVTGVSVSNNKLKSFQVCTVSVKPGYNINTAIKAIKKIPGIKSASANFFRKITYNPADPLYATTNWPLKSINADSAWNTAESQGWLNNNVKVAVLDTGIDTDHEDLKNKLWTASGEIPGNDIDDDGNGYKDDVNGASFVGLSNFPDFMENWDTVFYSATYPLGSNYPEEYIKSIAQEITGTGTPVSKVTLLVCRYKRPGPLNIEIRKDSCSGPVKATAVINARDIETIDEEDWGYELAETNLSGSVILDKGTKYYIVASTDKKDFKNMWYLLGMSGYETYTGGNLLIRQGSSWMPFAKSDLVFYLNAHSGNVENDDVIGGHGTHVSGVIAAEHNNVGISGVSRGAQIMSVKVMDKNGLGSDGDIIDGIIYAVDNGAKVINMSFSGINKNGVLQDAINYAHSKGVVIVAAAGNSGENDTEYPASCNNVISVTATTADKKVSSWSTFNRSVDVAAPGQFICSTVNGGGYDSAWSGTSMASPHVAGLAALLFAQKPTWSANRIINRIISTSKDLGQPWKDDYYGHGLIDAAAATSSLESSNLNLTNNRIINFGNEPTLSGKLMGNGWPASTGLSGKTIKIWMGFSDLLPFRYIGSVKTSSTGSYSTRLAPPLMNTTYRLTWDGDSSNQKAFKEFTVRVKSRITLSASTHRLKKGQKLTLKGSISPFETYATRVALQRSTDGHNWRTIRYMRINDFTNFNITIKPSKGLYYYRAFIPSHRCHYQSNSRSVRILVR